MARPPDHEPTDHRQSASTVATVWSATWGTSPGVSNTLYRLLGRSGEPGRPVEELSKSAYASGSLRSGRRPRGGGARFCLPGTRPDPASRAAEDGGGFMPLTWATMVDMARDPNVSRTLGRRPTPASARSRGKRAKPRSRGRRHWHVPACWRRRGLKRSTPIGESGWPSDPPRRPLSLMRLPRARAERRGSVAMSGDALDWPP